MPVPIVFRRGGDASVSYDWQDYTQGVGYRIFYGCGTLTAAGAVSRKLINRVLDSDGPCQNYTTGAFETYNGGGGAEIDVDFDVTFNINTVVGSGDAYLNFSYELQQDDVTNFTITLYHVRGVTETSIGTVTSPQRQGSGAGNSWHRTLLIIPVTSCVFAKGDILRLNIVTTGSDNLLIIYHDPASRDTFTEYNTGATIGTDMTLDVPFKIDM